MDIKSILFPTDFSDMAAKALDYIKQLRDAGGQEVVIMNVINQRIIDGLMRHGMTENDIAKWEKKTKEVAEQAMEEMGKELQVVGF